MRLTEIRLDISTKQSFDYDSCSVSVGATADTAGIDPKNPDAAAKLAKVEKELTEHLEAWLHNTFNKQFYALKVFKEKYKRAKTEGPVVVRGARKGIRPHGTR